MALLDRSALIGEKARELPRKTIHIPELGGDVIVQGMSGAQRDEFERSLRKPNGDLRGNIRARAIVRSVINEDGSRVFSDDDIAAVGRMRADIAQRIWNAQQELSGISESDAKELGEDSDDPEAGIGSSSNSPTS